jgi:hypothetical protein
MNQHVKYATTLGCGSHPAVHVMPVLGDALVDPTPPRSRPKAQPLGAAPRFADSNNVRKLSATATGRPRNRRLSTPKLVIMNTRLTCALRVATFATRHGRIAQASHIVDRQLRGGVDDDDDRGGLFSQPMRTPCRKRTAERSNILRQSVTSSPATRSFRRPKKWHASINPPHPRPFPPKALTTIHSVGQGIGQGLQRGQRINECYIYMFKNFGLRPGPIGATLG